MIYWAPFLHFYQPPTQFHAILKKVCTESYRPLIRLFESHPHAKATINICGVLTELLMDHGGEDVIYGIKALAERGQIELVGSSKYHGILPLLPEEEAARQIELNKKTNRFFFKDTYKPIGFFPPEMCFSHDIVKTIAETGHSWMLLSGVACNKPWPLDIIYKLKSENADMHVFFRDDILSNKISFHNIDSKGFLEQLRSLSKGSTPSGKNKDIYVITAMDAETFGHHIPNWDKLFLQEVYQAIAGEDKKSKTTKPKPESEDIKVVTISELLKVFPDGKVIKPTSSSWSSSLEDLGRNNFYPLWNDPDNPLHKYQWEHLYICIELARIANMPSHISSESKEYAEMARGLLDRAEYSCQWWWASKKPVTGVNIINKGLALQEEAIFNAYKAISLSNLTHHEKRNCYYKVVTARYLSNKIRDILIEA